MNEVSIIINGIRYDAVEDTDCTDCDEVCDLAPICNRLISFCEHIVQEGFVFKESKKMFEI